MAGNRNTTVIQTKPYTRRGVSKIGILRRSHNQHIRECSACFDAKALHIGEECEEGKRLHKAWHKGSSFKF